jgi:hypothetical protein
MSYGKLPVMRSSRASRQWTWGLFAFAVLVAGLYVADAARMNDELAAILGLLLALVTPLGVLAWQEILERRDLRIMLDKELEQRGEKIDPSKIEDVMRQLGY